MTDVCQRVGQTPLETLGVCHLIGVLLTLRG